MFFFNDLLKHAQANAAVLQEVRNKLRIFILEEFKFA
jgi:hypothetical protein